MGKGIDLNSPITLFLVTIVMSIFVGTTPTVILLIQFVYPHGNVDLLGAALILGVVLQVIYLYLAVLLGLLLLRNPQLMVLKYRF
ncbi:hypothetical protein AB6E88_11900 [Providencia hangzhouensis]